MEEIKVERIQIKPFDLTPELLMQFRKDLKKQKKLLAHHKSWCIQLKYDIEELEEIINHAGLNKKLIEKWGIESES